MNTTNLFVELIVIRVGTAAWLFLLVLSVFGYGWVQADQLLSPFSAIPILAVVYVLGIITDRVADTVFERFWINDLRDRYFADKGDYYNARRLILTQSENLSDLLEYGRSRLRICRGWAVNAILILVSLNPFLWLRFEDSHLGLSISIFASLLLVLFAVAAWFSWYKLTSSEYRKVKEQAKFLA